MLATRHDAVRPTRGGARLPPSGAGRVPSHGLAGRDGLVWRVRVLAVEAREPICLVGPVGSGSTAIASAIADRLAQGKRVLRLRCTAETTFARLCEILAEGFGDTRLSDDATIVLTEAGTVVEPGFLRALAHLGGAMPRLGWLIAGVSQGVSGLQTVPIPLLSESETALAVDAAVARHAAAISKIARSAAATLVRGLPGLADRLVSEAWTAVCGAGDDRIGLPHLRNAARTLAGPEIATEASPLRRAAARTPFDADGAFPRAALAIALERGGEPVPRAFAPEQDVALVAAGRGRLRFRDDSAAARLLLSEFGWTFHRR